MSEALRCSRDGQVSTVTLAQPEKGNPFTWQLAVELVETLDSLDENSAVRAVVLAAEGRHFCVGADLSAGRIDLGPGVSEPDWREPAGRVTRRILRMNKPVVAALRGASVGAGSTFVLACDYRLGSRDTKLGFVFTQRGIQPEGISAWFLPRLVGLGKALDWMISGRVIEADEALRAGLLHEVVDDVDQAALDLAHRLARTTSPTSVAITRKLLYTASGPVRPADVQGMDSALLATAAASQDAHEGLAAFAERRTPIYPDLDVTSRDWSHALPDHL